MTKKLREKIFERDNYTCQWCGMGIKEIPYAAGQRHILRRSIFNPTELKMLTADRYAYISDTQLISPEIVSTEIVEGYCEKQKTIHLCGKCRKAFEEFMKNKMEVCK